MNESSSCFSLVIFWGWQPKNDSLTSPHTPLSSASSLAVSWTLLCGALRSKIPATSCFLCWFSTCKAFRRPSVAWVLLRSREAPDVIQKLDLCCFSAAHQQTAAGCAMRKSYLLFKSLKGSLYSAASRSARSGACDPTVFPPEKISPDSLAAGREHAGWDVCFLQLLFVSTTSPTPTLPLPPLHSFIMMIPFRLISLHLFIFLYVSLISSHLPPSSVPCVRCQCSVSCGGGVQARTVQCLRQGRPAAGCLPYQRPVTSRACNTQFCPPAAPVPAQNPGRVVTGGGSTLKGKNRVIRPW